MSEERKRPRRFWRRALKVALIAAAAYLGLSLLVLGAWAVMVAAAPKEGFSR